MTTLLGKIVADFTTSLATAMAVGATSVTLQSATDDDNIALPAGHYFFAIDGDNAQKEHISCDVSGTSLTNIKSLSRQGVETSGCVRTHRVGSSVTLTDFAHIKYINDLVSGATTFNASVPLGYDGTATISTANQFATKAYVDGVAIAGGADASTTVKGLNKMSVAPASAASPIAVGDNDPRVPTTNQAAALVGSGTPSASDLYLNVSTLTGIITPYGGFSAPSGWLLCDGAAVSRATYANLFSLLNPSLGTATMTIASPAVVSLTAHGLVLDDTIYFTTTGALPTGVTANTRYYVISAGLTADAFEFSASKGGSAVNTSGSQSGVHTLRRSPYGVGDGSTSFNTPNLKGNVPVGRDSTATEFNAVGETGGEKTHTLTVPEMPAHTHDGSFATNGNQSTAGSNGAGAVTLNAAAPTGSTGGGGAHNNLQPYIALNYIIKT